MTADVDRLHSQAKNFLKDAQKHGWELVACRVWTSSETLNLTRIEDGVETLVLSWRQEPGTILARVSNLTNHKSPEPPFARGIYRKRDAMDEIVTEIEATKLHRVRSFL